jgi:GNAT superfamily N-acetyltransferase
VDERLERVEAEAFGTLQESAGLPVLRIAGATAYATPALPQNTMLNRVAALGLERAPSDSELDELDAFFRTAGVRYAVSVSPLADASLEPRLRERGFSDGYAWMKFRRGLEPPPPRATGLRVEETGDGLVFGRTVALAYGMPETAAAMFAGLGGRAGWHLFLAYDGAEPAGGAALYARDGTGWLGAAGTLSGHRGKGAQTALLAARVERARQLGLEALTTETGERVADRPSNSYRNILRAGFEEAYLRPNLVAPESQPVA